MLKLAGSNYHSFDCAAAYANKKQQKARERQLLKAKHADKKKYTTAKRKLRDNDKKHHTKNAQTEFNKYVRLRDSQLPCISCDRFHGGQYHAGHYRTVGANPELRFDERNCHKQCSACNNYLSGNIVNYRMQLIIKIGGEKLAILEGYHPPKNYTIENLKTITKWYKRKIKRLNR